MKTMSWHTKTAQLATDQGLKELTDFSSILKTLPHSILMSLMIACIIFSSVTSLLFLCDVKDPKIKWPIAGFFFIFGIIVGLIYFLYFYKRA